MSGQSQPGGGRAQRVPDDDWRRLGQEQYLRGARLRLIDWYEYKPGWDHDHCEFCGATFSPHAGDLPRGYATEDLYRWICPACWADFREEFGRVLIGH